MCLRSELLMDGYFDDPEATAAALDADGWYHSGDLGVLDDEGYLSIVGRLRDVLRTGGETVAPAEVEARARRATRRSPRSRWSGSPTRSGARSSARWSCRGRRRAPTSTSCGRTATAAWPPFKHPRRVELVDALPRTAATGQVQRTLLVERITAGLE